MMISKRKISNILLLLIVTLLSNCATRPPAGNDAITGIEESYSSRKKRPIILSLDNDLEKSNGDDFKHDSVGLILSSGHYETFLNLSLIKRLKEKGIVIETLYTMGLSSLIGYYFNQGHTESKIQWELFKLKSHLKNKKIYSTSWFNALEIYLKEKLGDKEILSTLDQLKILTKIDNKIEVIRTGLIRNAILDSVKAFSSCQEVVDYYPIFKNRFVISSTFNFKIKQSCTEKNLKNIKSDFKLELALPIKYKKNLSSVLAGLAQDFLLKKDGRLDLVKRKLKNEL